MDQEARNVFLEGGNARIMFTLRFSIMRALEYPPPPHSPASRREWLTGGLRKSGLSAVLIVCFAGLLLSRVFDPFGTSLRLALDSDRLRYFLVAKPKGRFEKAAGRYERGGASQVTLLSMLYSKIV